ncbi:hypothetical protein L1987_81063 [Smallanthus sonchifolius]|uniref:Uncharacterized protein n=1 Tax=Smallanthus sonchifolius TaxID=185202 RepID=A0ACB8YQ01_9ASTR|nr:hypothetical protein L1987_81063 [Smallanthus sonchifolius]
MLTSRNWGCDTAADQAKPSAAKAISAADRVKRSGKPSQQWKAKTPASIPKSIIIGSIECKHTDDADPKTHSPKQMTGNRSILSNFKHFNGGYVAFGSDSKGGSITGQGMVCRSQEPRRAAEITRTCSPPPEKILLTSQRKDKLYVLDMNEVTPSGSVSCFLSKASIDESALWHRRLSNVNVKTINKLVKGNLVRGHPDKEFQLEDHCIACLKGKQHRISHNPKTLNSNDTPLQLLHMDLFGPTNVMSMGKKS